MLEQALARQLQGLDLNRGALDDSISRRQSQLGAQLAGLEISDSALRSNFLQQQDRASRQLGTLDIQRRGALAQNQMRQDQLGRQIQGFEDDISYFGTQAGLRDQLAEQARQRSIFNFRDDFAKDTRSRLVDLIRSEADLTRFRTGFDPNVFRNTGLDPNSGNNNNEEDSGREEEGDV